MLRSLNQLLESIAPRDCPREVQEELQFHIEMQARDYEEAGLSPQEAFAKASMRFGDFGQIRSECVHIRQQNKMGTVVMKVLFTLALLAGVLIRTLSTEFHVTRIGDVLIMIAVFGGLFVLGKKMRAADFKTSAEPIRLGLINSSNEAPVAFDEAGRTPFERVRADD